MDSAAEEKRVIEERRDLRLVSALRLMPDLPDTACQELTHALGGEVRESPGKMTLLEFYMAPNGRTWMFAPLTAEAWWQPTI